MNPATDSAAAADQLLALVYELLDAHLDTIELSLHQDGDVRWEAHLDYLRALQRKTREMLAA